MKLRKIFIGGCGLFALAISGLSFAQPHCPESITCSSDSVTSCKSPDPSWQVSIPMVTVKTGDTFQFVYAFYNGGVAKCGYKRSNDNSITLSVESSQFAPADTGWPPAINGGARTCGAPDSPRSATSCPWKAK